MTVNIKYKKINFYRSEWNCKELQREALKGQWWLQLYKNVRVSAKFCKATDNADLIIKAGWVILCLVQSTECKTSVCGFLLNFKYYDSIWFSEIKKTLIGDLNHQGWFDNIAQTFTFLKLLKLLTAMHLCSKPYKNTKMFCSDNKSSMERGWFLKHSNRTS